VLLESNAAEYSKVSKSIRNILLIVSAFALGALLTVLDIYVSEETASILEFILDAIENSLVIVGVGGVVALFRRMHTQHQEGLSLIRELEFARVEGAAWRLKVDAQVAGVAAEIERQLCEWGLTEAETEIAWLVLKGLTHKKVAVLRGTTEATVR
jgi:hypothetical protein